MLQNPTALLAVAIAASLLCSGVIDWGEFARGARRFVAHVMKGKDRVLVHGDWRVECGPLQPDGSIAAHTVREWEENLTVNAGLNLLKDRMLNPATVAPVVGFIAMGTDATPEAAGQVALLAEVARGALTYTAGGTGVATIERTFGAGVGTGTIAEAGAFNDAVAGTMLNRKAFVGVPKAAGDTLKVSCVYTFTPA